MEYPAADTRIVIRMEGAKSQPWGDLPTSPQGFAKTSGGADAKWAPEN